MIGRLLPWLAPALLAPPAIAGLFLWREEGARIWLSGLIAYCS